MSGYEYLITDRRRLVSEPVTLEQRKDALFATITLIGAKRRQIVETPSNGALYEELSFLEAEKERLSHEVNSEYMYRNLQAFMNRVDEYGKETQGGIAALSGQFQTLAESVGQLEDRMDASEVDRADLRSRLERIEAILAARPAQREIEHQTLLAALAEQYGNGNT